MVPVALVVLLVAAGVGVGLSDWRAHRLRPEGAQTAAGGAPPGPLALAGGAPSLGFGFISTSANTLLIRNETTEAAPITIADALPQVAVSPSGHRIAYWRGGPGGTVWDLYQADTSVPQSIPGAPALLRTPPGEVPASLVWSSDGTGLIAATHTPPRRGTASSPPTHASWYAIDVASGGVTELTSALARLSTVYAWDRQRDLISGLDVGSNIFAVLHGGRMVEHAIAQGTLIAAADAYARSLVLVSGGPCPDGTTRCPVAEVRDQATFAVVSTAALGERSTDFIDVAFRPRSQDLIVQIPLPGGESRVELWSDLGRGTRQTLARYTRSGRFTARREVILPRADGSAVFLLKFDDSAGGRWFGEVVGLHALKGAAGFERMPFEIRTGGNPLASVALDPAFARALDAGGPSTSTPPARAPSAARDAIIKRFSRTNAEIRRIDRIDAKLMTRGELEQGSTMSATSTVDAGELVWAVAIGGEVVPEFGRGIVATWGVYVVRADTGDVVGMHAGREASWPPYFDRLPDRASAVAGASPVRPRAVEGSRAGPISTADIVARLNAAGLASRVSPPAPARLLLFNASDLDLISVDEPAIKGFTVYRYPSVAAASAAFRLDPVQDPSRSTISYVATPRFVGIGDALVAFATDDDTIASRVIAALTLGGR